MTIKLSVNLNKVALLRNSREGDFPSIEEFANLSLRSGAHGLTVHPRPDQRHIRASDVPRMAKLLEKYQEQSNEIVEFNIEGNPFSEKKKDYPGFIELVKQSAPQQCTLVPDSNQQKTSDHGFDLFSDGKKLAPIISQLKSFGCRVSLFMDPDIKQISEAANIGADRIELYTGPFAWAFQRDTQEGNQVFAEHRAAAEHANSLGLGVNAGHDLNLSNLALYKSLPYLSEVSIGHALTVDALKVGWSNAIKNYLAAIN